MTFNNNRGPLITQSQIGVGVYPNDYSKYKGWPNDDSITVITAPGKDSALWRRPRPSRPFLHQEPLLEAWQSLKNAWYIFHC